jgi:thiol-disulfide isomerase/thioredoxin
VDDFAAPPPPPKPRFFGPQFWIGFGFGILASFVLLVGGSMLLGLWMMKTIQSSAPGSKAGETLSAPPFPATGSVSDFTLGLETSDGTPFDAASVRGKTVFLNYWATWCAPCREEMPAIQHLYDRTRDLGVVFLLVSDEKPEPVAAYVKKNTFTVPVYRSTKGRPAAYQTEGIPATFILAPNGQVVFRHTGAARWDDDSTIAFLRSLPAANP